MSESSSPQPTSSSEGAIQDTASNSSLHDDEHHISFSSYQLFVFVANYFAYSVMLFNRKSFVFVLPHIMVHQYYSSYEIGWILGVQTFTYTISRFFSSWATDFFPPKYMLAGGLFFSGVVMLALADQDDWVNIVLLSSANGVAQGLGYPAASKMIRAWFPPTQFGLWYALLSTASNVVLTVGPGLATSLSVTYGWRFALQMPALVTIATAVAVPYITVDKPSDVGYEDQLTLSGDQLEGHWSDLAGSDFMALLSSSLCLLFIVKTGCMDWGITFLTREVGVSSWLADSFITSMEVGGIVGSIFVGATTDFLVRNRYYFKTGKSPRMIAVQLCVAGSCLLLNLSLFSINSESGKGYITVVGFWLGGCMYGAISLLGTITIEIAPIHLTGAAHAIVGVASNVGAVIAGSPMSHLARIWDWYIVFIIFNVVCSLVFFFLVIGKDIKASYIQESRGGPGRIKTS